MIVCYLLGGEALLRLLRRLCSPGREAGQVPSQAVCLLLGGLQALCRSRLGCLQVAACRLPGLLQLLYGRYK